MTNKEIILSNIKKFNCVDEVTLPAFKNFGITFENKLEQFKKSILGVGGEAIECNNNLNTVIKNLYPKAQIITSNVQQCELGNFNENIQQNPYDLKNIDLAVVKGEFAVAENGAVWIQNKDNLHRVLYFIAQNIVIIVDKNNIVNNMHEAYEKINLDNNSYGVFISGPSKTADIEQSLVIGAHGAKSLYTIFI